MIPDEDIQLLTSLLGAPAVQALVKANADIANKTASRSLALDLGAVLDREKRGSIHRVSSRCITVPGSLF